MGMGIVVAAAITTVTTKDTGVAGAMTEDMTVTGADVISLLR